MNSFGGGVVVGVIGISILWILYIAYFNEDADSMGGRVKRWLKRKVSWLP